MGTEKFQLRDGSTVTFDTETLQIWKDHVQINHPKLTDESEVLDSLYFDTLVLHISNTCNMQCEYCYESHNSYISAPGLMSVQTAIQTLDQFYEKYDYIKEIKLFGGEPALNLTVIKAVCEHVDDLFSGGKMRQKPVFKIITNGTILNEEFLSLIRTYAIKVVFSIDGNNLIHDQLRVYPGKKATFDAIYKNFFLMREKTDDKQPYSINATYTGAHEKAGITVNDLLWQLSDLFPVSPKKINIHMVTTKEDPYCVSDSMHMLGSAEDALEKGINGDVRTHTRLRAVIRRLHKGGILTSHPCPAADTWLAISHTGNVYPCMMFIDRKDCYMGNINETNVFSTQEYLNVHESFRNIRREDHECCNNCMAKNVCASCMGVNEFETGSLYPRSSKSCKEYREIVKLAVCGIAEGVW